MLKDAYARIRTYDGETQWRIRSLCIFVCVFFHLFVGLQPYQIFPINKINENSHNISTFRIRKLRQIHECMGEFINGPKSNE